jgi:hypothetical protein
VEQLSNSAIQANKQIRISIYHSCDAIALKITKDYTKSTKEGGRFMVDAVVWLKDILPLTKMLKV